MPQEPISEPQGPLGSSLSDAEARIEALEKTGQWAPGQISWTASGTAPPGWLVADGSTFDGDRYAALANALGGTTLPNLIDRFPVGAGGAYALLTTGGAASVTLTGAQSGTSAHSHPAGTSGAGSSHTHGGGVTGGPSVASTGAGTAHSHTGGAHTHTAAMRNDGGAGNGNVSIWGNASAANWGGVGGAVESGGAVATTSESAHTHSMQSHTHTLTAEAAHTHSVSVGAATAANAAAAHSVLNPYIALTPLIHI